jgi:hypothetical protein
MAKQLEPNEDWIKREYGRIPSKGAAAAERASGGLGTFTDDEVLELLGYLPRLGAAAERQAHRPGSDAQSQ